jgi:hypothetical protein
VRPSFLAQLNRPGGQESASGFLDGEKIGDPSPPIGMPTVAATSNDNLPSAQTMYQTANSIEIKGSIGTKQNPHEYQP